MSKPMREAMPTVAAWIDDLRAAFGAETIDAAIRGAVRDGRATFYAEEGGRQLGTPATLPDRGKRPGNPSCPPC